MAKGDKTSISTFNNIATQLRTARDKYYSGYTVTQNIASGTIMTAAKTNELLNQCTAVSAKSPKVYSFGSVNSGSIIQETIFTTALTNITSVATCYSNCHSNCYSNCHSNCHSNCNCETGRCPD